MPIMVFIRNLVLVVNITLFLSWYYASASAAFLHRPTATSPPWLLYRQTTKHHLNHQTSLSSASSSKQNVYIAFPGGGLFFYWQAGVLVSAFVSFNMRIQRATYHQHRLAYYVSLLYNSHLCSRRVIILFIYRPTSNKRGILSPKPISREHPQAPCQQHLPK